MLIAIITEHGLEDELAELLKPNSFDEIALDAAKELDSETGHFITQLYEDTEAKNNDDKIDEDGNPLPASTVSHKFCRSQWRYVISKLH